MASVVAADIVIYGAQNIAQSDGATTGGAIDATIEYIFDNAANANTLNDTVGCVSDDAGDLNLLLHITGRNAGGSIVSDRIRTNGLLAVESGTVTFERILHVSLSGVSHTGNISVTGVTSGSGIATLPSGVGEVRRPFYDVAADSQGGSQRDFYEKVFIKNNNVTNSLLSAQVVETGDPSGVITFALEDLVDLTGSISSRLDTVPTGVTAFSDGTILVPGTDLASGTMIGTWIKMILPAGAVATKTTWTLNVNGNTT